MPKQLIAHDSTIHHLLLYVPEGNKRPEIPIELEDKWVKKILKLCAGLFGGATAYGRGIGIWKSDINNKTYWDRVTVIEAWIRPQIHSIKLARKIVVLSKSMSQMGVERGEEAVMFMLDGEQFVIQSSRDKMKKKGR